LVLMFFVTYPSKKPSWRWSE